MPAGRAAIAVAPPQERGRGAVEAHERAQGYQLRQSFQIHDQRQPSFTAHITVQEYLVAVHDNKREGVMPAKALRGACSARVCFNAVQCQIRCRRTVTCSARCQDCSVDRCGPDSMNLCKAAGQQPLPPKHHIQAGLAQ